ncbi:ATP-binding protein [Tengunoibacter tsumagoiensis]|uniref:histidine kinase n=1 Tax=Tengunoibacter tsumagoiensis TaxID=2014871 RepID=A0A402A272_9CHLR|nr:ATP-binding protein [Tengunoibacter tsumagoiensis]GCE13224.1 hypothetical protein KTT_30830 [Tengunoibacter tsumagoiensis]
MESSVQSDIQVTAQSNGLNEERLLAIRQEMEYLNTIGKRFVAALDRFQVHRALLAALSDIYSFAACCILLKTEPVELFIIPCYPLNATFLESMIQSIANASNALNFPTMTAEQLIRAAYFDAPDELAPSRNYGVVGGTKVGSHLNIPLIVEDSIIGMLSLFDEKEHAFDENLLQLTTMIADYAAVALENVRLHERANALWQQTELERMRLKLILGSMTEGLLITNAKGNITELNSSARQLFSQVGIDFDPDQPLYTLAESSTAPWVPRFIEILRQALTGKTVKNQELVIGNSQERVPLTLSISAAPLYEASTPKRPIGVVAVLTDVTSSKQVERLKDEFVSVVSHELRTPLTTIKGYTQHLVRRIERRLRKVRSSQPDEEGGNDLPEVQDLRNLTIVQSQTDHLERLVNDLLDLSRVQWGHLELSYSTFHLADLLSTNIHSVQASAEQHAISLNLQVQETQVIADQARISQVVGNILDNAVKYSPYGGQVHVNLCMYQDKYLISISDQGIGVSPEQFDHIFERFYRVQNTASKHFAGIGLGLYVAKAIVNAHGGQIWLANNQGTGTTFHFTLPVVPPHPSPIA